MPSSEENTQLLWLIVNQKLVDGQLTAIEWEPIAAALGLEKVQAAKLRWSRLKKELTDNNGLIPGKATPVKGAAKKAAVPKAPMDPNATPTKKRTSKKRKIEEIKDEDDEVDEAVKDVDEVGEVTEEADEEEEDI